MVDRSPLAPKTFPDMPPIGGVQISVAETKLKYKGRPDLLMMAFDEGTSVADGSGEVCAGAGVGSEGQGPCT